MPITRRVKTLGIQLLALYFIIRHLRDELKNVRVLSQSTYRPYYLHWVILQAGYYRYALHKDISVNDGPYVRRRSHNIILLTIVLQLPTVFSTVTL
jgi:hypothetical protein